MDWTSLVHTVELTRHNTSRIPRVRQLFLNLPQDHQYFFFAGKREIRALPVKCDNIERQCDWVGTVGTLEEHVAKCQFTLLPCSNQCKDSSGKVNFYMRKDEIIHLVILCPNRYYNCNHCGKKGTYASIQVHDETCEKKEVTCPQDGCIKNMQRQHIMTHVDTTCEHAIIPCKYVHIGCMTTLKRKDMAAHEMDNEEHLHMALDKINLLQEKNAIEEPLKLKLTDYQRRKEKNEYVESSPQYVSANGYHVALRVYANGNGDGTTSHLSAFAVFLKSRDEIPFVGKITVTLLNQIKDKNHYQQILELTKEQITLAGHTRGRRKFISNSALGYNSVKDTEYLKDDTLYFRMSVEVADHKPWLQ